tara:strand:- start:3390 stop:4121 length:732 start_codon:yes stop_codon:yes gene_type:complete
MSVMLCDYKLADIGRYINLSKREDRNDYFKNQLSSAGITGVTRKSAYKSKHGGVSGLIETTFDLYKEFLETGQDTMVVFEDDCKFLNTFKKNSQQICADISNTEWDIFWLGGHNRKPLRYVSNNCYHVSSINYTQSYIITKKFAKSLVDAFSTPNKQDVDIFDVNHKGIDELLCLYAYSKDLVRDALDNGFYDLDQPLNVYKPNHIALCYKEPLTTQVNDKSDINHMETSIEEWLAQPYNIGE